NHVLLMSIHTTYDRIHLSEDTYQYPKEPPMFCMELRKHLSGTILEEVEQIGIDRIVLSLFSSRNEIVYICTYTIIMQINVCHSKLILINHYNKKIIDSIKHVSM